MALGPHTLRCCRPQSPGRSHQVCNEVTGVSASLTTIYWPTRKWPSHSCDVIHSIRTWPTTINCKPQRCGNKL
eukprot:2303260-Amphidinium_carterae.1